MEQPLVFFIIVGIAFVLVFYYGGAPIFTSGPIATGPGGGIATQPSSTPPSPLSFGGGTANEGRQALPSGKSPFQGRVRIASVHPDPDTKKEYITVDYGYSRFGQSDQGQTINLDGWTIENNKGERHPIPNAVVIPFSDAAAGPIQLGSSDELLITTGESPLSYSFRENICTGYLDEAYSFSPSLDESCPDFSDKDLLGQHLNSTCIDIIRRTSRCRQVNIAFEGSVAGNECIAFAQAHLNYAGCLADNRNAQEFKSNRWRIFLRLTDRLWDPSHDRATLSDKNGLIVDEYIY